MTAILNDIELWQGTRERDKTSFEKLFKHYYKFLIHYGLKHSSNEILIEDCVQELFIELWKKAPSIQIQSFRGYLFQSFRFKLYKYLKKYKRIHFNEKADTDEPSLFVLSKEDFIINEETELEKINLLKQALGKLSKRQQEIIYLRFYQNLDYTEISEIMDISYQVSRNLLCQSLKVLKKEIAPLALLPLLFLLFNR